MFSYIRMLIDLITIRAGVVPQQRGATMVEYALIVAIISLAVIVLGATFQENLESIFIEAKNAVSTATK